MTCSILHFKHSRALCIKVSLQLSSPNHFKHFHIVASAVTVLESNQNHDVFHPTKVLQCEDFFHYNNFKFQRHRLMHCSSVCSRKLEDSLEEKEAVASSPIDSSDDEQRAPKTFQQAHTASGEIKSVKKSLWNRFIEELKHYYHGFRLLGLNTRIASHTLWKILRGKPLVRRERNQFRRAVSDIFRLAPFSVFIIIPFAEFTLPIVLKLFPNMLPSTFETSSNREVRLKQELKIKGDMAKFLQDTVEDIAIHAKKSANENDAAKNFAAFFDKIRTTHEDPTNEEILEHAKLFEDQLTLDNMSRPQLVALCRLIQVPAVGTNDVLRFLLQLKLNRLHADDKLIMEEGIDSLTTVELMSACQARGMRSFGVPRNRLKQELHEWVDLHLNHKVPNSLLLLTRVLYLPDSVSVETKVKAAISTLPEEAAGRAEVRAAKLNLERIDNVARYKAAKLESSNIAKEQNKLEILDESDPVAIADKMTVEDGYETIIVQNQTPITVNQEKTIEVNLNELLADGAAKIVGENSTITREEIDVIELAVNQINDIDAAKHELEKSQRDKEESSHDIGSLTSDLISPVEPSPSFTRKSVEREDGKMIDEVRMFLNKLEKPEPQKYETNILVSDSVAVKDMAFAVQKLSKLPEPKLLEIFGSLDVNKDGHVDMKEVRKILQILNKEDIEVTTPQLQHIVQLSYQQLSKYKKS